MAAEPHPASLDARPAAKRATGEPHASPPSVAAHPRAARRVAQAREAGGLAGFLLAGYLSLPTHTLTQAALRALVAGTLCYMVVWAAAVLLWRQLVLTELRSRERALVEAGRARLAGADPTDTPATPPASNAPAAPATRNGAMHNGAARNGAMHNGATRNGHRRDARARG